MASWGELSTPGVSMPPEIFAYMQAPYNPTGDGNFMIFPANMNLMFQSDYSWFGFQNIYNTMQLMQDFEHYNYEPTSFYPSPYFTNTAAQWGISNDNLISFLTAMRFHVSSFLLEGVTKTYKVTDLVKGYETTLISKVNTGSLLQGNLYVDSTVTPIFSFFKGPASGHKYTMFTGLG